MLHLSYAIAETECYMVSRSEECLLKQDKHIPGKRINVSILVQVVSLKYFLFVAFHSFEKQWKTALDFTFHMPARAKEPWTRIQMASGR